MAQAKVKEDFEGMRRRMKEILRVLEHTYPEAECSLTFKNPFQLLVATILSAQCTDERVNKVTPGLFGKFADPEAFAEARIGEIEKAVQSTGFFRSKAKAIQEASRAIILHHRGKVPVELEDLVKLRGVGRKTANVVRGVAFRIPSLVVDTHVGRLSRRMGFTRLQDPVKVEHEMMEIVPKEKWTEYGHLLIQHGRAICTARKAYCEECPINRLCPKIGVHS